MRKAGTIAQLLVGAWLMGLAQAGLRGLQTTTETAEVMAQGEVGEYTPMSAFDLDAAGKLVSLDESASMSSGCKDDNELVNWGENAFAHNIIKHHPSTYDEVAQIVREVKSKGGKVRAQGIALHSWSNVFPDDGGHVIFLDKFKSIFQDPNDYTVVTIQAGVLNAELADWADSPSRGAGRFSYLPGNTLLAGCTFVGATQTASHGSGFVPPTPDHVFALTYVDSWGNIKKIDRSHPDFAVIVSCAGMCGIILDVTAKFNPDTSGFEVTMMKMPYLDLIPCTPINDTYNPLKALIEGHSAGAVNYPPFNSAIYQGKIDPNKHYDMAKEGIWAMTADRKPGLKVKENRDGLPIWGTQTEPFYDKDLFFPIEYGLTAVGSQIARVGMGDWRWNPSKTSYMSVFGGIIQNNVMFMQPPSFNYRTVRKHNTSSANANHFVKYMEKINHAWDYSFAIKADEDYANVYKAWNTIVELNNEFFRTKNQIPVNMYVAIRWTAHSESPLSASYGQPGDKFVLIEASCSHGTVGWEEFTEKMLHAFENIRTKRDGAPPKPHWGKVNKDWTPGITEFIKRAMPDQIKTIREAVLKIDPTGIFRNAWLSDIFALPY